MARGLPTGQYPGAMSVPSPDLAIGGFTDDGPWVVDPDAMPWRGDVDHAARRGSRPRCPRGWRPATSRRSAGSPVSSARSAGRSAAGSSSSAARAAASQPAGLSRRLRHRVRAPRPDLHQARPDHLRRRRPVPAGARRRVQAAARPRARPSRSTTCGAVVEVELGRSLDDVFESLRPHADRGGVDRAGARGAAAHRRRSRRQGAATADRASSCARTSRRWRGWRRASPAASRSPRSRTRPRSSSCSRRRSSRSSTSGSRRENMLDVARVLAETDQRALIVPRPHPTLVTRRVLVMERLDGIPWDDVAAMKRGRRRHRGGAARRAGRRSWKARCCTASSTATCTAAT